LLQFALDVAGVEEVQPLRGDGLVVAFVQAMPVARAERPNRARNGLVMLPSAMATAGWFSGM
jgi:hypothetical protein